MNLLNTASTSIEFQPHDGEVLNTVMIGQSGHGMSIVPPCPKCRGALSMPPRSGMSYHNCKCEGCGERFNFGALLFATQQDIEQEKAQNCMRVGRKVNAGPMAQPGKPAPYYRRFSKSKY